MRRIIPRVTLVVAFAFVAAWLASGVASAQRPNESQPPPRGGGERTGPAAAPRGGGDPGPRAGGGAPPPSPTSGGAAVPRGGGAPPAWGGNSRPTDSQADPVRGRGPQGGTVPWYSRPSGNNPTLGTATGRTNTGGGRPPVWNPGGGYYPGYYPPYYRPGYYPGYWNDYYWYGYGAFGLGYFYYDPFGWGYAPGYGYGGYGYGGYGGGYAYDATGSLRLKVRPSDANVFVDGYFAGRVDDFDGVFQRLKLKPGPHKIEISAPGYAPLIFDVDIRLNDTVTYEGVLEPIR